MTENDTPAEQIAALLQVASAPGADLFAIAAQLSNLSREFGSAPGGQADAVAAQQAAVTVLRLPESNPGLAAEHSTRLAEYLHTLAARFNDAGDHAAAVATAREAFTAYQQAAQVTGAEKERIVGQLTQLSKLCSGLGQSADALAASQTAVALQSAALPVPPSPEQQLALADLQQNLAARYLDVQQTDQADLTGQLATQGLTTAATTVWSQVAEQAQLLTGIARQLLAADLTMQSATVLRAAQSAVQDAPTLLVPGVVVDPDLPEMAVTHVTRVGELKDLVRRILESSSTLGAVLARGGLVVTAATAQALTPTFTPGRFCGITDPPLTGGGVHLQIFGPVSKRWPARQALRISINPTGCNLGAAAVGVIQAQFAAWAAAIRGPAGPVFNFQFVPAGTNEDISVSFTVKAGDPATLGSAGGVTGLTEAAPSGTIRLDPSETWNNPFLASTALHEVGHVLGLSHSTAPGSVMYPYSPVPAVLDAESIQALTLAYAPGPQQQLPDRATSGRPALAASTITNFTGAARTVHMVWKGAGDDSGIYHSELGAFWSTQERVPAVGTSHSPALLEIGPVAETQLMMAWKGVNADQGLYWTRWTAESGWEERQHGPISGRGSACGPALADTSAGVFMAWRGIDGDQGIYTSIWDGAENWSPQFGPLAGRGTSHTPAVAVLNGRLYMFWKGIAGDTSVWWSVLDLAGTPNPIWSSQKQVAFDSIVTSGAVSTAIGSTTGPVASTRGNNILLAWKGAEGDSQIWLSLFDGTTFTGQLPLFDAGTSYGPGLIDVDGTSYLAWKGIEGDSTIWWKTI